MSEYATFERLKRLYEVNEFARLIEEPEGIYWLKLRSLSRKAHLEAICHRIGLDRGRVGSRELLRYVFEHHPSVEDIDDYMLQVYEEERSERRANEDHLVSQLYQMQVFDWGGLYQNSLEQTIVNNYIKKIRDWNDLNRAIDEELHVSLQGYVRCSWYNHWSSILIEDIVKDHSNVLPTIGLAKKVDFFIHDFPFDLKVTYFPDGFMGKRRKDKGLKPELTVLKQFCKQHGIWFDKTRKPRQLFTELLTKVKESPLRVAQEFFDEFRGSRSETVLETLDDPTELIIWLYENQGQRRFDAANRLFLILVNLDDLEESWKLKRNRPLLQPRIHEHLSQISAGSMQDLKLQFTWNDRMYETYADILPILVDNKSL